MTKKTENKKVSTPTPKPTVSLGTTSEEAIVKIALETEKPIGPESVSFNSGAALTSKLTADERKLFARCRKLIKDGVRDIYQKSLEVGDALRDIHDKQLFREQYKSFADYCAGELDIAKTYAYDLKRAATVRHELSATAENLPLPSNERQIRPLLSLKTPQEQKDAWKLAVKDAGQKPVTEGHVRKVVQEMRKKAGPNPINPEPQLPTTDWREAAIADLKIAGFVDEFEQPFKWPSKIAELYSETDKRHVKFIDVLTLEEAVCTLKLKEKHPEALVIIRAETNAPDGLVYSITGEDIIECFPPAFNVMAKHLDAFLLDVAEVYEAGDLDGAFEMPWKPVKNVDFTKLGIKQEAPRELIDALQPHAEK